MAIDRIETTLGEFYRQQEKRLVEQSHLLVNQARNSLDDDQTDQTLEKLQELARQRVVYGRLDRVLKEFVDRSRGLLADLIQPPLELLAGEVKPAQKVEFIRIRETKWLTQERALEFNRQIGGQLDGQVSWRGLHRWNPSIEQHDPAITPESWINFMRSLSQKDRGMLTISLGRIDSSWYLGRYGGDIDLDTFREIVGQDIKAFGDNMAPTTLFLKLFFQKTEPNS